MCKYETEEVKNRSSEWREIKVGEKEDEGEETGEARKEEEKGEDGQ